MRIQNETHWRTEHVSKLIYRVAQDELDPGHLKQARVFIKYLRSNGRTAGTCTYGTAQRPRVWMTLYLPQVGPIDIVELAHTIGHELAHARGLRHREMNKSNRYSYLAGWRERYGYALQFPVDRKPETAKPSREEALNARRLEALSHAQGMVAAWSTKAKKANTLLKKWRIRLKAAERRTKLPPLERQRQPEPTAGASSFAASA